MKRSILMMSVLTFSLALFVPLASARATMSEAVAQDQTEAEAAAYKAWFEANGAKDYAKAMDLAKAYLDKFPSGKYADYLKNKWIPSMRGYFFNQAVQAKNMAEMLRIGKEVLSTDADNIDYLWVMINQLRVRELYGTPPDFSHAADYTDFVQRVARLIEAGKMPTGVKDFKKDATLAFLNYDLGVIEAHNKNVDKAIEYNTKAATLDPTAPAYPFACGSLHQQKYASAAQKYQAFPEADQLAVNENKPEAKPEVKAALDEANKQADAVIECWARYVAMTKDKHEYDAVRGKVETELTKLYTYRHPDAPTGLQKLIDQYRSGSPPASSSTSAKPPDSTAASARPDGKKP
jgi:thioredoxin-like negative regulator of GroEL